MVINMNAIHNSQDLSYRNPFGAVELGENISLSIEVSPPPKTVRLHLIPDEKPEQVLNCYSVEEQNKVNVYKFNIPTISVGIIWYYFSFSYDDYHWHYYGNNSENLGGVGQTYSHLPPAYQITCYQGEPLPSWYSKGIIYQIFPDRFNRGSKGVNLENYYRDDSRQGSRRIFHIDWNDRPFYPKDHRGFVTRWGFFGGTLKGIEEKLSYLKSLGVSTIYLNPIFKGASNHKYDTANYMELDPGFGTVEDFKSLAKEAAKYDIYLMLDGVFSHTGADSIYFNLYNNHHSLGAAQSTQSPYYSWYRFTDYPNKYECWWGVEDLPNVNEQDENYQNYLFGEEGVIKYWMELGAKGWRLDVADELPGSFIVALRDTVKDKDPDGLVLGEVWEDASNKVSYGKRREYLLGQELDCTMNYPFRLSVMDFIKGNISATKLGKITMSLKENYPPSAFLGAMNMLSTHDTQRIITNMGMEHSPEKGQDLTLEPEQYSRGKSRVKLLTTLQFTSPGIPSVYYGDEVGVEGMEDPYNRATYPWGKEDKELLGHTQLMARIRDNYPVLKYGDYQPIHLEEDIYGFWRSDDSSKVAVLANRSRFEKSIWLELPQNSINASCILNCIDYKIDEIETFKGMGDETILRIRVELPPLGCGVISVLTNKLEKHSKLTGAGVLLHLSSLEKIDDSIEKSAKTFIDTLKLSGQGYWQILPLNPVDSYGSPYSSSCVFAGEYSLLGEEDIKSVRYKEFGEFCHREDYWLDNFALYTVLKNKYNNIPWQQWSQGDKYPENTQELYSEYSLAMEEIKLEQYRFWTIWQRIKGYANQQGIGIIGDLPIYVASDSADVWSNPQEYKLDSDGYGNQLAGVPPDYFSEEGQSWGNPLYNWEAMSKDGFNWWKERIAKAIKDYDYIRLDHFRGFAGYYTIPAGSSAKDGYWQEGVGRKFFDQLTKELGTLPIIAEDLGDLDGAVYDLLHYTGFYGIDVYQFKSEEVLSKNYTKAKDRLIYSGTHDNQTLLSWLSDKGVEGDVKQRAREVLEKIYSSNYSLVITPLQDILLLDDLSRMNTPGTVENNWKWKIRPEDFDEDTAKWLYNITKAHGRTGAN